METRTIPSNQWVNFFDEFNAEHLGWPVTLLVLDRQSGPMTVAESLPLQGISFDTKGTRPSSIEIAVGDQLARHVSHVVDMPLHIRAADEGNGSIDIEIEPANGPVTLVHLRGPIH